MRSYNTSKRPCVIYVIMSYYDSNAICMSKINIYLLIYVIYVIMPYDVDNAICMLKINIYSMRLNVMNLQLYMLIYSVSVPYCWAVIG